MGKYNKAIAAAIMALAAWLARRFHVDLGLTAEEVDAVLLVLIPVVVYFVRNTGYFRLSELPPHVRPQVKAVLGDAPGSAKRNDTG